MKSEEYYKVEFGKQVAKYLKKSGLDINDFAHLIKSNTENVKDIINGKVGLTIKKMVAIASLFGQVYYNFANPNYPIPAKEELIKNIKDVLARRKTIGKKPIDTDRILASELDRLITEGYLNTPTTAKLLHSKMDKKLAERKSTEITSLLTRPPRNKEIIALKAIKSPKVFVHKDYVSKYEKMTKEDLIKLVKNMEKKAFGDKEDEIKE